MKKNNMISEQALSRLESGFIDQFWEKSWTYIKTVVDVVREPVLILDGDLRVMATNKSFYKVFQVEAKDTLDRSVYKLGNGQWDIYSLRELLENILSQNSFFNDFEVVHIFPKIGRKVMMLNARQIFVKDDLIFPPIILLAIEDITDTMDVAKILAKHTKRSESAMTERTGKLENQIRVLKAEVRNLKAN